MHFHLLATRPRQYHTRPFTKKKTNVCGRPMALPSACRLHQICFKMRKCVVRLYGSQIFLAASMHLIDSVHIKLQKSIMTTINSCRRLYFKWNENPLHMCAAHSGLVNGCQNSCDRIAYDAACILHYENGVLLNRFAYRRSCNVGGPYCAWWATKHI